MRVRAVLAAMALTAAVAACGGSSSSPGASAAPPASSAPSSAAPASAAPSAAAPSAAAPSAAASGSVYVIKKGDTLYAIAQRYKVTLKALEDANPQLKDPNVLKIGDKINIPSH